MDEVMRLIRERQHRISNTIVQEDRPESWKWKAKTIEQYNKFHANKPLVGSRFSWKKYSNKYNTRTAQVIRTSRPDLLNTKTRDEQLGIIQQPMHTGGSNSNRRNRFRFGDTTSQEARRNTAYNTKDPAQANWMDQWIETTISQSQDAAPAQPQTETATDQQTHTETPNTQTPKAREYL